MPEAVNPYIAGNPITGTEMFFGREDVFEFVKRSLSGEHRDNALVLYGQRRTGKTSVLYHIRRNIDPAYLCVFIDLHALAMDSVDSLLWDVASYVVRVLRRDYAIDLPRPDRTQFMVDARDQFRNEFLASVKEAIGDRHLLLMLDEVGHLHEKIQAGELDSNIFEYLRHLMQHYDWLDFLYSLGSSLEEMQEQYSLLFSVALCKRVSFLSRDAAIDLITKPVHAFYRVEAAAVDRILDITSGHPYFTQLVCHCLFARWQQKPAEVMTVRDVEQILDLAIELGSANLEFVWTQSTASEKALMAGLAACPAGRSRARDVQGVWSPLNVTLPEAEMARATRSLAVREVVLGKERYRFTVDLQRLWVRQQRRLDWVKEEIAEVLPEWTTGTKKKGTLWDRLSPRTKSIALVIAAVLAVAGTWTTYYLRNKSHRRPVITSTPCVIEPGSATADLSVELCRELSLGGEELRASTVAEPSVAANGQVVLYTGNWYAAVSQDGGQTFQYLDPETTAQPKDPPTMKFCCHQVVDYIPEIDTFVWLLQYGTQENANLLRLAFAKTSDVPRNHWRFFDIKPADLGAPGTFLDFPDLAVGSHFLYVTTNIFREVTSAGSAVIRLPIAGIASGSPTYQRFVSTDLPNFRVAQNCAETAYFATHLDTSTLTVFSWPETEDVPTQHNVGIARWIGGNGYQSSFRPLAVPQWVELPSGTSSGDRWLDQADPRILGATLAGDELWFAWSVDKGTNQRPQPFVQIARINARNFTSIKNVPIFDQDSAIAYPSLSSNADHDVGISYTIGGGNRFPSQMVGILTGLRQNLLVATGTRNPPDGHWGNYLTIRTAFPDRKSFIAAGYTLRGSGSKSITNATPNLVIFRRAQAQVVSATPAPEPPKSEDELTPRPGIYRWPVKTGADPDARLVGPQSGPIQTTVDKLIRLAIPGDLPANAINSPYQNKRACPIECKIFTLQAKVILLRKDLSGDYKLVLQGPSGETMIAAAPNPDPAFVSPTSRWANEIKIVRDEIDKKILPKTKDGRLNVMVRITGVGFFDLRHGRAGEAPNGIQLHPVIKIEFPQR